MYGVDPISPIELTTLPIDFQLHNNVLDKVKVMKKFYENIKLQIKNANEVYKTIANKHE